MIRVLYDNICADDAEVKFQNENVITVLFISLLNSRSVRVMSEIINNIITMRNNNIMCI